MGKPKIRFKGYEDDWEQRKWIDVVDISTEMVNPTTGEYDNMPHIAPGNIESFTGRILDNVKTVKEEQLISGKFRFRPDDVVYGKINPQLGKYFYATVNGLTSADAYVFNGKNGLKQKFLFALLQTSDFFKYSVSVSKRSGMPKINRDELNAYSFLMPSEEEQDRIGSYLLQLDHLITLHQRKCYRFIDIALDAWEQRKLGEVAQEFKSGNSLKADEIDITGDYPVYGGNGLRGYTSTYNHDGEYALIGRQGALCGNMNYSVGKAYFTEHAVVVKADENNDTRFLYYMLDTMNLGQYSDQSAQPGLAVNKLVKLENQFPMKEEQQRIGWYFSNIDHLITLHQRKCEETKSLKKYMLQKMFPENGNCVPKIRFSGFADAWEQRKLSDIYASIGNAFVGTATPYYVESGHFYLESNNIKDGQINHNSEIFINDEFYEKQKDKWLHTGDMVMVQSGHVGHAAVIPEELDNSAAHALIMFRHPKEKIEPYFLNYQYQTNKSKKKIEEITTGNTIKHILASDMQEFVVDITNYDEQKKIGSYFQKLDHLITLHQHKCDELQKLKKFMLQNMFV